MRGSPFADGPDAADTGDEGFVAELEAVMGGFCDCENVIVGDHSECLACRRYDLFDLIGEAIKKWEKGSDHPKEALKKIAEIVREGCE